MIIVDKKIKSIDTVKSNLEAEQFELEEKFSLLFSDREKLRVELELPRDENLKRKNGSEETPIKKKHARINFDDRPQQRLPLRTLNRRIDHDTKFKEQMIHSTKKTKKREPSDLNQELEAVFSNMEGISEMFKEDDQLICHDL